MNVQDFFYDTFPSIAYATVAQLSSFLSMILVEKIFVISEFTAM